jgi:hypothetical protein
MVKCSNGMHKRLSFGLALACGFILALLDVPFAGVPQNAIALNNSLWLEAQKLVDNAQFVGLSRHAAVTYKDVIYVIGGAGDNPVEIC